MRTTPRLMAAVAAVAGFALTGVTPASAQNINLNQCSSWSIVGGIFTCTPLAGGNGGGGGGGQTITPPSACTVNVSPSSGPANTAVAVSVSCGGGSAPTNFSWSGGFMQGSGQSAGGGTASGTTTFSVVASNSAGAAPAASGTFTAQSNGNGGGNSGGGIACTGYQTAVLPASWPTSGVTTRSLSNSVTTFGDKVALVVKFTTGSKPGFGRITGAEWGSSPTPKTAVLSASPCDFGQQASLYALQTGVTVSINFSVGPNSWGYPALDPNTTYYLNVKNEVDGAATCNGACDIFIDLKSP
ncbi:MAG: hypothetical protein M3Z31_15845 [Pseudomonadota bacterium]|nr:hypothetical protein [Pseudomonadota bacterium]